VSGETIITVVGNLTADPDLKVTSSGAVVVTFTIASTPRTFDKNSNSWKDAESLFMRCSLWREAGEHAADSLTQGTRVIATGALKQRSYEKDGQKRTVVELDVEEIGPSLKYATAKVTKASRSGQSGGNQQQGAGQQSSRGQQSQGGWGGAPQNGNQGGWGGGQQGGWGSGADTDPPF